MNNFFIWDINPAIFTLGPFELRWYSLLFAAAFLMGYKVGYSFFIKHELARKNPEILDTLLLYIMAGTIIGSRLGHCFFYEPEYYFTHLLEIFKVWKGGLASHGGMAGIFIAIYLFCRKYKEFNFLWVADRLTLPSILGGAFIRTGNFFNSEILGLETDVPWAVIFARIDLIPRHPAQLYEAFSYYILFFTHYVIMKKTDLSEKPGFMTGLYLINIFTVRFFIEFVKTRQVDYGHGFFLSIGQSLSVPVVIIGILLTIFSFKYKKPIS